MVVGRDFAWAHLPKAGGDMTLSLFELFPELVVDADPRREREKHTQFLKRLDRVGGKRRVLNIRRLPSWILSYTMFKARPQWIVSHARYLSGSRFASELAPLPVDSPRQMAESIVPDRSLSGFLDLGPRSIDVWFRVEHLAEDFLGFVSELTDVGPDRRRLVVEHPRVNDMQYDRDLSHWFSDELIAQMYESNPLWAWVEREVYGETLAERARRRRPEAAAPAPSRV